MRYNRITFTQKIFDKLGLMLRISEVNDTNELIASIKENIDNERPIVLILKYCTILFLWSYLTDHKYSHAILISDYDDEKKIMIIRECLLNREVTQNVMRGDPFFKLQLTEDLISDVWLKSNKYFKEENSNLYNKLISVEKVSESRINSYIDLVDDFINNYSTNENNLIRIVNGFNDNIVEIKDSVKIELMRRNFHGSMTILFDIFEKAFEILKQDQAKQNRFFDFKDKYIKFRDLLMSKLHAQALREKDFDTSKKNEIIDEIHEIDSELFALVNELYLHNKQQQKEHLCKNAYE